MVCPKCMCFRFIVPIGTTHYLCQESEEIDEDRTKCKDCQLVSICERVTGCGHQFKIVEDEKILFPSSAIFSEKGKKEFYRKLPIDIITS